MPRHHVISRLTRYFPTVWVDPLPYWRDRLDAMLGRGDPLPRHSEPPPPGMTIAEGGTLGARVYRPTVLAEWLESRHYLRAQSILRSGGCRQFVGYLWRDDLASVLDVLELGATCYHIDDEYSFSETERPISEREGALIRRVDSVICHSSTLMRKKGGLNPNSVMIPNGVDWRHFATDVPEPADVLPVPRPRVGYHGVIKRQLDLELLLGLVSERPQWSFVFVGPIGHLGDRRTTWLEIASRPNVHVLGHKPLSDLPAYVQHMDVNIMPYRVDDYTKYIYPLKLHEYLAGGRPVVSSTVPAVTDFQHVVEIVAGNDQWLDALGRAIAEVDTAGVATHERREAARPYDWDVLVARIARTLVRPLGESVVDRVRETAARVVPSEVGPWAGDHND